MEKRDLATHYAEITLGSLEPGRTIHVFSRAPGVVGDKDSIQLTEILEIAKPAIVNGKIRYRHCHNGTPGKKIFEIDLNIFMGKKPNPEDPLWRIPK